MTILRAPRPLFLVPFIALPVLIAAAPSCGGPERHHSSSGDGGDGSGGDTGSGGSGGSTVVGVGGAGGSGGGSASGGSTGTGNETDNPDVSTSAASLFQSETSVVAGPNGSVAIAWIDITPSQKARMGYVISSDDGKSFPVPSYVDAPGGRTSSDPVLAVDKAGNFYLTWVGYFVDGQGNPSNMHIYVSKAPSGSTTFGAPIEASDPADTALLDKPWIVVTNSGGLVVTYERGQQGGAGAGFGLVAARSQDGVSFKQTYIQNDPTLSTFTNLAYPCVSKGTGRIWVAYVMFIGGAPAPEIDLTWSDDEGATWSPQPTKVSLANEIVNFDDPNCAGDSDDVWVSYSLTPSPPTGAEPELSTAIRVAHSANGGSSIASRINAEDGAAAQRFLHPQLSREEGGALDLVYYAGNFDQDSNGSFRRSRAADPKAAFSPSITVYSPLTFLPDRGDVRWLGDYVGLFVKDSGIYMSYAVNDSGSSLIAFSKDKAF